MAEIKKGALLPYSTLAFGSTDYIKEGTLRVGSPMRMVLVSNISEMTPELTEKYEPGTICYTAGFAQMWQLSPSGVWTAFS